MVAYAKGVPLALQVLGSFLSGKTEQYWESALKKLDKCLHMDIQNVLEISYNELDEDDRKIFLDIACFFKGWKNDLVKEILDASGFDVGLKNLIDKCLINISYDIITMHDLLQEMGKTIVRRNYNDPGKYSRLWKHEDIYKVLTKNSGTEAIEGIFLDISKIRDIDLKPHTFEKMHNLRIFRVYNSHDQDDYQKKLLGFEDLKTFSMELTYFSWERYPYKSLPQNFHAENLVILHMPGSKIEQLWNGIQNLVKLKHVDLSDSIQLTSIPDLSKATNLQELILRNCKSLASLPEGIQSKFITLEGCIILLMVPKISCKVEHLDLSRTAIRNLPYIEQPSKLVTLNISDCSRLENLSNMSECKCLEYLYLKGSSRPESLLDDDGNLESLETLIGHGNGIRKAMSSFVHFTERQQIGYQKPVNWALNFLSSFFKCLLLADRQFMKLPEDLGQLSSLKRLNLSGNNFESMPTSIKNLFNLEFLDISNCERLVGLPELPSGLDLEADNCSSLESISKSSFLFSSLVRSRFVNFSNCFKLNLSKNLHKESPREFCTSICYPGNEVPKWFQFQGEGSSITPELPPDWMNENLLGFNMCVVLQFPKGCEFDDDLELAWFCTIKRKNNEVEVYANSVPLWAYTFLPGPDCIGSDHVFVRFINGMQKFFTMQAPQDELTKLNSQVTISFYTTNDVEVKKCGVHFLYDYDDCSSFMISDKKEEDGQCSSSGPEFGYLKKTVKHISEGFNKLCASDYKDLFGVEIAIQEIESLLEIGSDIVCIVEICGEIGIGKTTIVQVLLNKILTKFEGFFFFHNHFENTDMLKQFLFEVLVDEDIYKEYWLKYKRILFIFDDRYWSRSDIEYLIGDPACMCSRSRIIITTLCKYSVISCGVKMEHMYEVKSLCRDNSLQLFSKYAFGQDHPTEDYVELSEAVVKYALGHPLHLKMLGSCLFGKRKQDWEYVVDILQRHENDLPYFVPKISYDFLNVEAKSVLADSRLLRNSWYRFAVKACNAKGIFAQKGLNDLSKRFFITISNDYIITMEEMSSHHAWHNLFEEIEL